MEALAVMSCLWGQRGRVGPGAARYSVSSVYGIVPNGRTKQLHTTQQKQNLCPDCAALCS
jgi:hypothetical protein